MAGMKGLYIGIGAVAVVGGGALMMAARGGGATLPSDPIDVAAVNAARMFGGYVIGADDAPIEVVEYADFECPACRVQWVLTVLDLKRRLVDTGRIRMVFRDFPLAVHPQSRAAHHAAACADEQGLFWEMHDKLFETQPKWTRRPDAQRRFRGYVGELGADLGAYDACMAEGRYRGRIQASVEGGIAVGVNQTPSYLIGDRVYPGLAYDAIKALVDSLAPFESQ